MAKADVEAAVAKIYPKIGGGFKPCFECGKNNFTITDELAFVPKILMSPQGNTIELESGQAFVTVSCNNRGSTRFFNYGMLK